uniref:Protein kinase domain-containing protein n=1 Tax=Leptocylindrus danicus TaxID=163516 RepID=A0A7S2KB98_9STRA
MTGETGSYRFMAPEVFRHERYNESVDVYSYAMIFFNILSGHQPWPMLNGIKAASAAALEGRRPYIPRDWDNRIVHLLKQCWDEDPSARPSFSRVLADLNVYSHHVFNTGENDVVTAGVSSKCSCAIM